MALKSFVEVHPDSHFSIHNLPYGIFKPATDSTPRPGVAIGKYILDLAKVSLSGLFDGPHLRNSDCFTQSDLNKFLSLGRPAWKEARATIQKLLSSTEPALRDNEPLRTISLILQSDAEMLIPVAIQNYTDFFSSMHHAKNCFAILGGNQIPPNWFHLPIAYNGRASSIVLTGTDIVRPLGQSDPAGSSKPKYDPSAKLDFELEMAAVIGTENKLGNPVGIKEAENHIFGLVLMNDWSARDIQAWESTPLGPFLGKNFGTTISPWIVTLEALEPFICDAPKQDPIPLPYLVENKPKNYDISLEVYIRPAGQRSAHLVTKSNLKHMYWTLAQQLAHHTSNGCNLQPGDLLGTGTISGPDEDSLGCLLELTKNGEKPLQLTEKISRRFLEDGDEVLITGQCKGNDYVVGFGTCVGKIVPSIDVWDKIDLD